MYVLGSRWSDGYLDYALLEGHLRIEVRTWAILEPVTDQYFIPQDRWRMLFDRVLKVSVRGALAKIKSRQRESGRNDKYVSVGTGVVTELACDDVSISAGDHVAFLATNHPRCVDRVAVDQRFVIPWRPSLNTTGRSVAFFPELGVQIPQELAMIRGWSPFSGVSVDLAVLRAFLDQAARTLEDEWGRRDREMLAVHSPHSVREFAEAQPGPSVKPTGVLFGFGHYARTHILPNIGQSIDLRKIHELDPLQIGPVGGSGISFDTRPYPRSDQYFDVFFVAGYHHMHSPIALTAVNRGAYAVVEKPLATSLRQFHVIAEAIADHPGKLFVGFHKRYSRFNALIKEDIARSPGGPLHYDCILHEVSLPKRHWYTWPSSNGRIVYNGCHFIDHFLFLNDYARVTSQSAVASRDGHIFVHMELSNGALFNLTMSPFGSFTAGEREYVEVHCSSGMASMTDGIRYESTNRHGIKRRAAENAMHLYRDMYRSIAERIAGGEEGDGTQSLASSRCALELQQQLNSGEAR